MKRFARSLTLVLLVLGLAGYRAAAQSSSTLPTDSTAVFKTIVPHRNSLLAKPAIGLAQEDLESPSPIFGFTGSPYTVGATTSPTSTVPEAEEHIAADPNNFENLIAMISDFSSSGGFNISKFAFSSNNGVSWTENFVPLSGGSPVTSDGHVWQANSDPVVAIDLLGNVYLANLYLQVDSFGNVTNDGLYVCSATLASGPKFTKSGCHKVKTHLTATSVLEDKEWIAADNSTLSSFSGNVYATWTHFTATSNMIYFSRSTDHGVTWSAAVQINSSSQNGAVQGPQVAVGPRGAVYVAYEVFLSGGQGQHFIAQSKDGGVTFGTPVAMTPTFTNLNFSASYRINSFPALAVGPVSGNSYIYDVYTDQPGTNARTALVRQTTHDDGLTFNKPVRVNDSTTGQRLMPAVAVDTNSVVHMSWFDTRNFSSADNLDIYATYSLDNASNFAPNAKVNSTKIQASTSSDFLGDYSGIAAGPNGLLGMAYPAWTSAGLSLNGHLQTTTLTVP